MTGALPAFPNATSLAYLTANDNMLTGTVPSELIKPTLKTLHIQNNQMSGELPAVLATSAIDNYESRRNGCFTAADAATRAWLSTIDQYWDCGCTTTCM